ncbi:uncharacterized protein VP01_6764g1 [Puccinia sorghi]|uniref:MULE transposase domain-containing protein n=1 Tax=Puccinia sorghi TaxID=27349 RepID=A0A0L6UER0_9BASI|nr:uncharacterized protein VP01_6764g1 [Puccinia sorghi]
MVCTWHIENNILTNATLLIKNKDLVHNILSHWFNLIKISTPSEFVSAFSGFSAIYPRDFISYMEKTWIPLVPWFELNPLNYSQEYEAQEQTTGSRLLSKK